MKTIKLKLDMDLLVALMRGEGVTLCGVGEQPSVELILEKDDRSHDGDEAADRVRDLWEW